MGGGGGGSVGGGVRVCVSEGDGDSERSDAGMLHVLDKPISPVIKHTQHWSGDGSALIKASTSLLRSFRQTNTRSQNTSRPLFHSERICDQPEMRGHANWVRVVGSLGKHTQSLHNLLFSLPTRAFKVTSKDTKQANLAL